MKGLAGERGKYGSKSKSDTMGRVCDCKSAGPTYSCGFDEEIKKSRKGDGHNEMPERKLKEPRCKCVFRML